MNLLWWDKNISLETKKKAVREKAMVESVTSYKYEV